MTLAVRNTVVRFGAVVSVALLILFVLAGRELLAASRFDELQSGWSQSWLVWTWIVPPPDVIAAVVAAGATGLAAAAGLIGTARIFSRVNSSEVYFFSLFLLALSFEPLRVMQPYLLQANLPSVYGVLLTRIVTAARIGGAVSLFAASLYAVGVEYPRIGTVTAAIAVACVVFVAVVPVDGEMISATMLHRVNGQASLELVLLVVCLLSVVNYAIAGARGHRERGLFVIVAIVTIVIATQILWWVPSLPWLAVAVFLLVYGSLTFILVTRAHFLWF